MGLSLSLTGNDTLKLRDRVFADFADGDYATLTFPNDIAALKTGKDGNTIYALNETGRQCELVIRVLRGSSDDKFLQNILATQKNNFSGFVTLEGELVKRVGDGQGNITTDTYLVTGGVFTKNVEVKSSAEGDTDQSVSVYTIHFGNNSRTLG